MSIKANWRPKSLGGVWFGKIGQDISKITGDLPASTLRHSRENVTDICDCMSLKVLIDGIICLYVGQQLEQGAYDSLGCACAFKTMTSKP
jgi:hypothetical protein